MSKLIRLIYVGEAKEAYLKLNQVAKEEHDKGITDSENQRLLKSLKKKEELLKINPEYGNHIPRDHIKKETIEKYGTDSLWRIDIYNYWRAIYALKGTDVEVLTLILDIVSHDDYNKLFHNYKKK